MDSKERALAAIDFQQTDRVPMDFHANPWVYERLHRDLGTSSHRELLLRLRSDIVDLRGVVDPVYHGPVPLSRDLGDGVAAAGEGGQHEQHRDSDRRSHGVSLLALA